MYPGKRNHRMAVVKAHRFDYCWFELGLPDRVYILANLWWLRATYVRRCNVRHGNVRPKNPKARQSKTQPVTKILIRLWSSG